MINNSNCNNIDIYNINSNDNNDNNIDNSKLFFKIFRNKYLKSQIINHIHLYNKYNTIEINSYNDLKLINNFQYKSYISKIKYNCNEPIYTSGLIPSNVTTIEYCDEYNQSLAPVGSLPDTITTIIFGRDFNQPFKPIEECLAQSVIEFNLDKYFTKIINLDGAVININEQQQNIQQENQQQQQQQQQQQKQQKKKLFGRSFKPAGALPSSVQNIIFSKNSHFNQPLSPNSIPPSCVSIVFGDDYNQQILPGSIPPNVQLLKFGRYFSSDIFPNSIPTSTKVIFGKYYQKKIQNNNNVIIK